MLHYKRLEKGTFKRPSANVNAPNSELSHEDIYMILRGIDFEKTKKRKRYLTLPVVPVGRHGRTGTAHKTVDYFDVKPFVYKGFSCIFEVWI